MARLFIPTFLISAAIPTSTTAQCTLQTAPSSGGQPLVPFHLLSYPATLPFLHVYLIRHNERVGKARVTWPRRTSLSCGLHWRLPFLKTVISYNGLTFSYRLQCPQSLSPCITHPSAYQKYASPERRPLPFSRSSFRQSQRSFH